MIRNLDADSALLRSALDYAARGWGVIPLHDVAGGACSCGGDCSAKSGGKHPRTAHGLKDGTTDAEQIRAWWTQWPAANVGVCTGAESGIVMLGPDGDNGIRDLAGLEERHGHLDSTPTAKSGSGGRHLLFRHPGDSIKNRKNHLGTMIDVRGDGGYFVAAPSANASGRYEWIDSPDQVEVATMPQWLIEWVRGDGKAIAVPPADDRMPYRPTTGTDAYSRAVAYVAAMPPAIAGQRGHDATFAAARACYTGFALDVEQTYQLLRDHYNPRCVPPWSEGELRHKAQSAADTPSTHPRGYLLDSPRPDRIAGPSARRGATTATEATEQPAATPAQKPTTAKILVEIARTEAELWHNDRQRGYATIGRRSLPIRATQFRQWLTSRYRKVSGGHVANSDAIANALTAIEAEAVCDGPTYDAYTRVARHNGRIYLHLADEPDTVIEIGPGYWRESDNPPVRFRRSPNAKPLPMPKRGGSLDPLRRLLNIESDSQFALVVGWLCGALRGAGPYPTLVITGNHGSGKSTAENTIKRLIDPTAGGLRSQPREERDLMVAANNSHVLAFDNFSTLPDWLSDSLCRLATGGGLSTRGLYTDDDEVVFEAVKPTILNGINDFVSRPDLLDRAILLHLPTIPDDRRRTEDAYWADFGAAHPLLLGAILDRLAHGLAHLDTTDLAALPRMADFARFAVACESAGESGQFLRAFGENENAANEQAIENSSLAIAIVELLATRDSWEGTPTDLLAVLAERSRLAATARDWPKTASVLSGKLTRLAPSLRKSRQIEIAKGHCGTGDKRSRTVRLSRIRDGDGTAMGRRGTAWDGDPAQTPSQTFALKTSGKDAVGTPWDGRDGVSPPSAGTPSRRLYGAKNRPGEAKGGPAL